MTGKSTNTLGRRAVLGLLFGSAAQAVVAQTFPHSLDTSPFPIPRPADLYKRAIPSAERLIAEAQLSGQTAFTVADAATGEVLETQNPVLRLPPASVAKSITAIYALEHLGSNFHFETNVIATGPITGGEVQGDLVLVGGGDPLLDTDMLGGLAEQLKARGITGATGRFLVWDGALPRIEEIDAQQTEYAGYNPTVSGLNVNFNRVHFEWRKQGAEYSVKMDARAERYAPDVKIARMTIASRNLPVFDREAGQGRDEWSVARSALGNGGSRWLPVRLPALYAGEVFQAVARHHGVRVGKPERVMERPTGDIVASHKSPPLTTIVRDMLKYSTNLTAEVLGLAATRTRGVTVTGLEGSAREMNTWAKERLGARHLGFVDHSGLGGASVVTTSDMVRILSAPGVEPLLSPLLKPIGMPTKSGKDIDPNHPVKVAAKTGTLDFVSTLAGYVDGPDGRRMAFATFSADLPARVAAKEKGNEVPKGARTFNSRAKKLQKALLNRWGLYYASDEIN